MDSMRVDLMIINRFAVLSLYRCKVTDAYRPTFHLHEYIPIHCTVVL